MKKTNKKAGRLLLFTVLFTMMLVQTALAETSGKVTADSVKIRSSADASSTVVGSTEKGKTVSVMAKTTDANGTTWYQVYVDENTTGYIRGDLIEVSGSVSDVKSSSNNGGSDTSNTTSTVTAASGTGMVTPPSTNIRNAAVTGDVVCTLQSGAMVTITGETTGSDSKKWYQVSFIKDSKNYTGFIRADLVDTSKTAETNTDDAQQADANQIQNTDIDQPAEGGETDAQSVPDNVSLKSLTISSGTMTPAFDSNVTSYTIEAEESTMEIAISAVVTDSSSQITSADGFKDLQPGLNAASIVVTAADGTSQTYSFSIICGDVTQTAEAPEETEESEEESIEVEGAMEEVDEGAEDMVDISEYEKYKELAGKRLIIMCVLGFLLAVAVVIIINLLLKIHDLGEEDDEEDEEEEEKPAPRKAQKQSGNKKTSKKPLFEKHEYVKLDEEEAKPLKATLSEKEKANRAGQKKQKSVIMPDLRQEAKEEDLYQSDASYEDSGLDDDFEFEFINLDSKR